MAVFRWPLLRVQGGLCRLLVGKLCCPSLGVGLEHRAAVLSRCAFVAVVRRSCTPASGGRRSTARISECGLASSCGTSILRAASAQHGAWDPWSEIDLFEACCDGVQDAVSYNGETKSFVGLAVRWSESAYPYHALGSKLDNELVVWHVDDGWCVGESFAGLLLEGRFCGDSFFGKSIELKKLESLIVAVSRDQECASRDGLCCLRVPDLLPDNTCYEEGKGPVSEKDVRFW